MLDITKRYVAYTSGNRLKCSTCGNSRICLPAGLTKDQHHVLDRMTKARRLLNKDEVLHYASESQPNVHVVSTGSFRSVINDEAGAEQVTNFYFPGDMVGLDALGDHLPESTVIANERSTVCEISESQLSTLCEQNAALNQAFNCGLRSEIVKGQEHMMLLGQLAADARIAMFILDMSKRYELRGFSPREFMINISRHDLANYLGLTPETLSRRLHKLQNMECLRVKRGHIAIINMEELQKLAGSTTRNK